ncbi:nuclear transport factor 2 family protein [Daejeonella lutea]|uniref:Putative lumazine-binding n=1 Tax=Daejeonella lutea TaxID=572036 RepID=A0A1T5BRT3_9SPHI|nr:nuclear transport factor 2 family protein [Daejeonella lutea]SKB49894.1 Putative lumazine-binding [Daejeonella lutea]
MKIRSFAFSAVLIAAIANLSFAGFPPRDIKSILSEFADSHVNSDVRKMEGILSETAVLKFTRENEVQTYSQQSIIHLMKLNLGVKQNCTTQIGVIADSDALAIAKVNFIYDGFVIENYLTLEWHKGAWKITRIDKFFNADKSPKVLTQE